MADTIVSTGSEDNYGFNLEWIAEGSGIGEEICGVDKDCIVVPTSPIIPKIENCDTDYIEIQVTEEEVIAAQWDDNTDGVGELEVGDLTQDVLVPLDEEQDEYSRLHPYPCDFCSRRFSKQSSLTVHMLTHQTQRLHDCNMCGATYRRKLELVEHMKIHSYAPVKTEEDFEGICVLDEPSIIVKPPKKPARARKKKKKNNALKQSYTIATSDMSFMESFNHEIKQEYIEEPIEDTFEEDQKFPVIDPARPYVCQFCGIGFAREKALISHKLVHAGDSTFECDRCSEIFQSASKLVQHVASRHGAKAQSKKSSSSLNSRKVPKEETIPETEGIICEWCSLVLDTVDELVRHKEFHDATTGIHTCNFCHSDYVDMEDLKVHLNGAHSSMKCNRCFLLFKDRFSLSNHYLTHSDISAAPKTDLVCNVCSRKFSSKVALKRHASTHADAKDKSTTSIICVECGSGDFVDGRSLLYHRQIEHGVNMSRLFPCLECGKTFNSRSSQQIHIRIHTGERPYGCRFCWKAFGDGGTLRKHERIHTGEKPYVCPVCSKAFNQRVVLREHVRAHHSGTEGKLSDTCYECMVCGQFFGTSDELCAHLVQHSDENTAKHRTPSVRKTNITRRKKSLSSKLTIDEPPIEIPSPPKVEYKPTVVSPPPKKKSTKSSRSDNLDVIMKLGKSTLENLASMSDGKRARIVRSGKKGFSKGQNKRYLNKKEKGKTSKLLTNGSYASKYAVSQPGMGGITVPAPETVEGIEEEIKEETEFLLGLEGMSNGDGESSMRTRPRTKNVSYHNMKVDHKSYNLATFQDMDFAVPLESELTDSQFLLPPVPKKKKSCKKKKKSSKSKSVEEHTDSSSGECQYINGITLEPPSNVISSSGECEYINGITIDPMPLPEQEEQIETTIVSDDLEIKQDGAIACQICSEIFLTSDELLKHIHSHF